MDGFYARYLEQLGELPLISESDSGGECYRLLHAPSFLHKTLVRVELTGTGTVAAKAFGGSRAGPKLVFNESRTIASVEMQKLRAMIEGVHFWRMAAADGHMGLDGEDWILEGRRDRQHHVVNRWSPDPTGANRGFVLLCNYMIEIAPRVVVPPPTPQEIAEWDRRRVAEEQERRAQDGGREAGRARSNTIAQRLHAELTAGRPLTCPHCRQSTNGMRFIDKRPDAESYFVCDRCKRSSVGLEIENPRVT
jgi:hypothetical protein